MMFLTVLIARGVSAALPSPTTGWTAGGTNPNSTARNVAPSRSCVLISERVACPPSRTRPCILSEAIVVHALQLRIGETRVASVGTPGQRSAFMSKAALLPRLCLIWPSFIAAVEVVGLRVDRVAQSLRLLRV